MASYYLLQTSSANKPLLTNLRHFPRRLQRLKRPIFQLYRGPSIDGPRSRKLSGLITRRCTVAKEDRKKKSACRPPKSEPLIQRADSPAGVRRVYRRGETRGVGRKTRRQRLLSSGSETRDEEGDARCHRRNERRTRRRGGGYPEGTSGDRRVEHGAGERGEGQEAIGTSDRISLVNQIWPNKRRGCGRTGRAGRGTVRHADEGRRARENSCASCVH